MKVACCLVALVAVLVSAEELGHQGRADPVPTDKCATSIVPYDDERLYVFALSEDSVVWHKYQKPEGGWSTWKPVANCVKMGSGPKAVRYSNGTMQVFARGADRKYYYTTMTSLNEWADWQTLGDRTFHSPPSPIITAGGSCLVFGIAAETKSVWYTQSTPITSDELSFSEWADLGGEPTSPPSVLLDGEGLVHVFVRGQNRGLWHLTEAVQRQQTVNENSTKGWAGWECLGGVMASSPKIPLTLNGASLVEVYGRAADKALWHRRQRVSHGDSEVEWDAWTSLGGVLASGPAVALNDDGMVDVYARATDKAIYYKSQFEDADGVVHFSQWRTLGGMFSSTPSVVVRMDGLVDVFARGVDKAIWHSHQVETNGTRTFTSWHSLGGHTRKYAC